MSVFESDCIKNVGFLLTLCQMSFPRCVHMPSPEILPLIEGTFHFKSRCLCFSLSGTNDNLMFFKDRMVFVYWCKQKKIQCYDASCNCTARTGTSCHLNGVARTDSTPFKDIFNRLTFCSKAVFCGPFAALLRPLY
jgi:hypothetical protein